MREHARREYRLALGIADWSCWDRRVRRGNRRQAVLTAAALSAPTCSAATRARRSGQWRRATTGCALYFLVVAVFDRFDEVRVDQKAAVGEHGKAACHDQRRHRRRAERHRHIVRNLVDRTAKRVTYSLAR